MLRNGLRLRKTQSVGEDERTKRRTHFWSRLAFRRGKSKGAGQSKRGMYATLSSLSSGVPGPASVTTAVNDDLNTVGDSSITPLSRPSRAQSAAALLTSAPAAETCGPGCTGAPVSTGLSTAKQTEAEAELRAEAEAHAALLKLARLRLASASSTNSDAHLGGAFGQHNGNVTDVSKMSETTDANTASGAAPRSSTTQQSTDLPVVDSGAAHALHTEDDDVCAAIVAEAMAAVHRVISGGNSKSVTGAQAALGAQDAIGAQDASGLEIASTHPAGDQHADQPGDECERPASHESKDGNGVQRERHGAEGVGPSATLEPTAIAEAEGEGAAKADNRGAHELERFSAEIECSLHGILREIEEAANLSVAPPKDAHSQPREQSERQRLAKDRRPTSSTPQQPPTRPPAHAPTRLSARLPSSQNAAHGPSARSTPSPLVQSKTTAAAPFEVVSEARTRSVTPPSPALQSTQRLQDCTHSEHAAAAGATLEETVRDTTLARVVPPDAKTPSTNGSTAVTVSSPFATRHETAISPSNSRTAAAVRLQKSVRGMQARDELRRLAEEGREEWIRYYLQRGEYWEAKALGWKGSEQASECVLS
mmetsp:Transcript_14437/g.30507  ORF Transcript_14437/g.30507 Transcript_14437/m.30507 type:complete len:594 (+) Transcript_14437:305-2086(+)